MSDNIDIIENILSFSDEHEWFDYKENWFQKKGYWEVIKQYLVAKNIQAHI